MTIREALVSAIGIRVTTGAVDKVLIDRSLNGDLEYTRAYEVHVDVAAVTLLRDLMGLSSISEGDMSISLDNKAIERRLLFLAHKHGLNSVIDAISPRPKVSAVKKW